MTPILRAAVRSVQLYFAWPLRPHHVQYCRFRRTFVVSIGGLNEVSYERLEGQGGPLIRSGAGVFLRIAMISLRL